MADIQDKIILNKIARRWAKGILEAATMDCEEADECLSPEEQMYVVNEVKKIAEGITKEPNNTSLSAIIQDYFELKEV